MTLVRNGGESTVSNAAIVRLAENWRARGASVRELRLGGMPLSHDVVEPLRDRQLVAKSYPPLLRLLDGKESLLDRGRCDQPERDGARDGACARVDAKLARDARDVRFDRPA